MSDMLRKLRNPFSTKSIVASILFAMILVPFIFFDFGPGGGQNMPASDIGGSAAVVGGRMISLADFENRYQSAQQQYNAELGQLPAAQRQKIERDLKGQVLEQLINQELIATFADRVGVQVADSEVRQGITTIPFLQSNGQFDRAKYEMLLQNFRLTAPQYEAKIRDQIRSGRLTSAFRKSFPVSPIERERDEKLKNTNLNLEFVKLNGAGEVSKAEADAFLKSEAGAAEVKKYYDDNQVEFSFKETAKVKQMIFEVNEKQDDKTALAKVQEAQKTLKPETFKGAEAEITRGQWPEQLEKIVFSLPEKTISEPVKMEKGYHLFMVENRKAAGVQPFETVSQKIAQELLLQKKWDNLRVQSQDLVQKNDDSSLRNLVSKSGLKWEETGEFDLRSEFVPKFAESDEIFNGLLGLKPENRSGIFFVQIAQDPYLFRLKTLKSAGSAKKAADLPGSEVASFRQADEAFETWATDLKKQEKIQRNTKLLGM